MIDTLSSIDRSFFLFINSLHISWLDKPMIFFSGQIVWLPLIILSIWMARKQKNKTEFKLFLLFLTLSIIASDVTSSYIFKNIFLRLRPCRIEDLSVLIYQFGQKCGGRFGFVSSHAANSIALVAFTQFSLNLKNKAWYLIWLLPLLVGYSRIYLGVHYPGDILGGFLVGMFWGSLLACSLEKTKDTI